MTISPELVAELAARYTLPRHVSPTPTTRSARDLPRELPAPRGRAAAARLPGHAVDQRRPLRPARPVRRDRRAGHLARRLPGARGARVPRDPGHPRPRPAAARPRCCASSSDYDFGWAGFNAGLNGAHLDTALPNKLYEYLGCGLPVITLQHTRAAADARRGGRRASRSTTSASWPRRWRRPTWRRCGGGWRSGASGTRSRPRSAASRRSTTRSPPTGGRRRSRGTGATPRRAPRPAPGRRRARRARA